MNNVQKRRYSRHLVLDGIGLEGQEKLLNAKVLLIGVGGLGSPIALYLAAAGVGTIGLADGDEVSLTNLQRQVIHATPDVGRQKVDSAAEKMTAINPDIRIIKHDGFLTEDTIAQVIDQYDFIVEGTDSFAMKYLVSDACVMGGKPFCIGGINRFNGQVMTHVPGTACYRCIFPEAPKPEEVETCAMVGVLGTIAGMTGTIQATEVVKYITGTGTLLTDRLLTFDALTMQWHTWNVNRNSHCALCGEAPTITELKEYSFMPCSKRKD